jgi:hypothetical protein
MNLNSTMVVFLKVKIITSDMRLSWFENIRGEMSGHK